MGMVMMKNRIASDGRTKNGWLNISFLKSLCGARDLSIRSITENRKMCSYLPLTLAVATRSYYTEGILPRLLKDNRIKMISDQYNRLNYPEREEIYFSMH